MSFTEGRQRNVMPELRDDRRIEQIARTLDVNHSLARIIDWTQQEAAIDLGLAIAAVASIDASCTPDRFGYSGWRTVERFETSSNLLLQLRILTAHRHEIGDGASIREYAQRVAHSMDNLCRRAQRRVEQDALRTQIDSLSEGALNHIFFQAIPDQIALKIASQRYPIAAQESWELGNGEHVLRIPYETLPDVIPFSAEPEFGFVLAMHRIRSLMSRGLRSTRDQFYAVEHPVHIDEIVRYNPSLISHESSELAYNPHARTAIRRTWSSIHFRNGRVVYTQPKEKIYTTQTEIKEAKERYEHQRAAQEGARQKFSQKHLSRIIFLQSIADRIRCQSSDHAQSATHIYNRLQRMIDALQPYSTEHVPTQQDIDAIEEKLMKRAMHTAHDCGWQPQWLQRIIDCRRAIHDNSLTHEFAQECIRGGYISQAELESQCERALYEKYAVEFQRGHVISLERVIDDVLHEKI